MPAAALPKNEKSRLAALRRLAALDSQSSPALDAITRAASLVCGVPIALVSLIDEHRQWFKCNVGLDGLTETPRDLIRKHRDDPAVQRAAHGEVTLEDVFIGLTGSEVRE